MWCRVDKCRVRQGGGKFGLLTAFPYRTSETLSMPWTMVSNASTQGGLRPSRCPSSADHMDQLGFSEQGDLVLIVLQNVVILNSDVFPNGK